ncbi:MAG: glycosyltransferase [Candidatus Heimdallarchaeaceae archaeon]
MRVLLISYFFPPQKSVGGFRASSLCKYLPEHNIDLYLLTSSIGLCHDPELQKDYSLAEDHVYCVPPSRIRDIGYKTKLLVLLEATKLDTLIFFPDVYCTWIRRAVEEGKKLISKHKPELIIATGPPFSVFIVGNKLAKIFGLPIILDYRDPWNGNPSIRYNRLFVKRRAINLERKIAKNASKIVTIGENCAKRIAKSIEVPYKEIGVVYNGYFEGKVFSKITSKLTKTFSIGYFGSIYHTRKKLFSNMLMGMKSLIDSLSLSPSEIRFYYAGYSSRNVLKRIVKRTKTENYFEDLGMINKNNINQVMQKMNILVAFLPPTMAYMIPTKLYDYAASISHILLIGGNDGPREVLDKINQEYTVTKAEIPKITETLNILFEQWKNGSLKYGCDMEALKEFSRKNQAAKYAKIIQELYKDSLN